MRQAETLLRTEKPSPFRLMKPLPRKESEIVEVEHFYITTSAHPSSTLNHWESSHASAPMGCNRAKLLEAISHLGTTGTRRSGY